MISVDHIRLNASCVRMPHVSYGNISHLFFAFIVLHIAAPAERDVDARCRGHNSPSGPDCYSEILSCKSQAAAGHRTLSTLLASIVASLQLNTLTWCTTVKCIGVPWLTLFGLGLATFCQVNFGKLYWLSMSTINLLFTGSGIGKEIKKSHKNNHRLTQAEKLNGHQCGSSGQLRCSKQIQVL